MNFQNTLFSMPLMVGLVFVLVAFITLKFPPKKINMLYGYRTKSAMKSQERWNFAQRYSSKLMLYCGFGLIILAVLGLIFNVSEGIGVLISTILMIIAIVILLVKTEKAIKQNFIND